MRRRLATLIIALGLAGLMQSGTVPAGTPVAGLIVHLEQKLKLTEPQVKGALGALLIFARDRLSQTEFKALASRMPNAEQIIQDVTSRGIVTRAFDDLDDYEETLTKLGIAPEVASGVAPAVLEWLGATGYDEERDMLAGVLD
jgi:hypothetical protein